MLTLYIVSLLSSPFTSQVHTVRLESRCALYSTMCTVLHQTFTCGKQQNLQYNLTAHARLII
jgi:hypothetical protein